MKQRLTTWWYEGRGWLTLLLPLAWLYQALSTLRRLYYRYWQPPPTLSRSVPLIVVGNIALGGTGKTPLLIALANYLQQRGFQPGILSRGYGSRAPHYPFLVEADSSPAASGDEPLLLARRTRCPVVIDANRVAALKHLLGCFECDLVLSDDGLQHYRLPRDLEIAVIDGKRGLGNGLCLPAGPLRESPARLRHVDWVVCNGEPAAAAIPLCHESMALRPQSWHRLPDESAFELNAPAFAQPVHAVAGIGNPQRFFDTLRALGLDVEEHPFDDHHRFTPEDIDFGDDKTVVMTEKDAIKIRPLLESAGEGASAATNYYYLRVAAELSDAFLESIHRRLTTL